MFLERRNLCQVAVIRLCGDASRSLPPFTGFPETLRKVLYGGSFCTLGGFLFDGRVISDVAASDVRRICSEIRNAGVKNVVISGLFSPNNAKQELEALEIVKDYFENQVSITLSSAVGDFGLLERENASILNETLKPLAYKYVSGLRESFAEEGLKCPLYITANDGTLMSLNKVMEMPVSTFSSGPTNSMRGAMFLSSLQDAIVADVGGTTTDVGVLVNGFPRPASTHLHIHGVRINFQMPDVYSIALGGGSIITDDVSLGKFTIGPRSVGSNLTKESLVFGGTVLTASDVAVAAGIVKLGDPVKVAHLSNKSISQFRCRMKQMLEDAIDRVKTSSKEPPLILVGGGSELFDEPNVKGCCEVIKPKFGEVANAVGAALSQVSGSAEEIVSLVHEDRETAVQRITKLAVKNCVLNGGFADGFEIVEKVTDPLAYLPGNVMLIKIKVVSMVDENKCDFVRIEPLYDLNVSNDGDSLDSTMKPDIPEVPEEKAEKFPEKLLDCNGDWVLSPFDIDCILIGAGIMGCGGGGSTHLNELHVKKLLRNGKTVKIRSFDSYHITNSNVRGLPIGGMGAPNVGFEQLKSGEAVECLKTLAFFDNMAEDEVSDQILENQLTCVETDDFSYIDGFSKIVEKKQDEFDKTFSNSGNQYAVVCIEIGGGNALLPLAVGAALELPVLDCDLMGRAFPELQMVTTFMHGLDCYPSVLSSFDGRKVVVTRCNKPKDLEDVLRKVVVEMGCVGALATPSVKLEDLRRTAIIGTYTESYNIGRVIMQARKQNLNPIEALKSLRNDMTVLIRGKITDVVKRTEAGFMKGHFVVETFSKQESEGENSIEPEVGQNLEIVAGQLTVEFQNEYLIAFGADRSKPLATVPNLISVVDLETAEAVMTPELKYGLRVCVLVLKANSKLLSDCAMQVVGPRAFGYDCEFVPLQ